MRFACILAVAFSLFACGSSDSNSSGSGGSSSSAGSSSSSSSQHTCAELATCCASADFAAAVAEPGSKISQKQCDDVSSGTNEPACNSLYNGYQLLHDCP